MKKLGTVVVTAALCGAVAGGTFLGVSQAPKAYEAIKEAALNEAEALGILDRDDKEEVQETPEEKKQAPEEKKSEDSKTSFVNADKSKRVAATDTGSGTISEVAKSAMPSIVAINVTVEQEYRDMFGQSTGQTYESEGAGSGIIVSQDDDALYIATNNHVVSDASKVSVEFIDDASAEAEVLGTDAKNDLAVVKVPLSSLSSDTLETVRVAALGDSDELSVGDSVIAIGNALGYGQSVTTGIVSALNREVAAENPENGAMTAEKLIQTDAAINPGNSGGALLNQYGEVVGINSSKYADTTVEGMCFAIPINSAKEVLGAIIDGTIEELQMSAGYLGVSGIDVTAEVAENYSMPEGVYIAQVVPGSAAEKAGLMKGQIITKVDDTTISSAAELSSVITSHKGGDTVQLTVQTADRGGYIEEVFPVTLGSQAEKQQDMEESEEQPRENAPRQQEQPEAGGDGRQQYEEVPYQGNPFDIEDFFRYFGY